MSGITAHPHARCALVVSDGSACSHQAAAPAEAVTWRARAHLRATTVAADAPAEGSVMDSAAQAAAQARQQAARDTTQGRLEHRLDSSDGQQQGGGGSSEAQAGGAAVVHEQPHATSYAAWIHSSGPGGSDAVQEVASGTSAHAGGGFRQTHT